MRSSSNDRLDLSRSPYRDFDYPRWTRFPLSGEWKSAPETFSVEEIPLYPFSGQGEHAVIVLEKTGVPTRDLAVRVARNLGIPPSSIGYAGMKDKACVAIQSFTVLGVGEERARSVFEQEGCRVLAATRHGNKLRLGHLAGNRFRALVKGADPAAARAAFDELEKTGVPNYYGPQRFGTRGDNAAQGLAVLQGRRREGRWKRDLLVSALQALVFNEVAARRIEERALDKPIEGDVLRREDSGGLFVCTDANADAPRVRDFEVSPTGPMLGKKMVRPSAGVAVEEAAALSDLKLDESLFLRELGSRRPLRARVRDWSLEPVCYGVWVSFSCPAGVFATSVIREFANIG